MKLNPNLLYEFFTSIGINYLYHANTVTTACTFIESGGLLSRGAVEKLNLKQTPQNSDAKDKKFNVWNDIFLDCCDLHKQFSRQNKYGPVLFKLNVNLLLDSNLPDVWITKDNPIYWNESQMESDRYFSNVDELKDKYSINSYKEMITLRFTQAPLSFKYIEEIIVDRPGIEIDGLSIYKMATKSLSDAIHKSKYDYSKVKKSARNCINCYCCDNYLTQYTSDNLKIKFTKR